MLFYLFLFIYFFNYHILYTGDTMFKKFFLCFFIIFSFLLTSYSFVFADDEPSINSRSAVVIDRNSGTVLYGKNENNKVKMASTTKIMTATVVIENCSLNDTVIASKKAANTGGSRLGLKTDDKVSVNDLLYGLMLCSGNDAAVALAEHVGGSIDGFADMMNSKAEKLGLTNTHFVTPHGLDKDEHYTTAYELAVLTDYALNNETFAKVVNTKSTTISINGNLKEIRNTNELLGTVSGVYGVKTGFTNGANRCLVSACKRGDLDVISVVLGADTKAFRGNDSIKILDYCFNNFSFVNISEIARNKFTDWKNENINSFNIYKSSSKNLNFDLAINDEGNDLILPIKNSDIENITCNVDCTKDLFPPIKEKSVIGKLCVSSGNKDLFLKDIYLNTALYRKNFLEYFIDILKRLPYK